MSLPAGYVKTSLTTAAVTKLGLPGATGTTPVRAFIRVEGGSLRWRDDGVDPSATDGMLLNDGDSLAFDGSLGDVRLIRMAAVTVVVHASFYGI